MPFVTPQSLSDDQVYALSAYILYLNGIIDEDDVMNASTLARIEMPNRDGFILAYPSRADN
jgi:cytochrome c